MDKQRQVSIDVTRCIMNYMVILLHAWAAFQYVQGGDCEFILWTFICSHVAGMAIPSFFLISGYLLFKNFRLRSWPDKIWRRIKRLAVPYLAWNTLFVLFYLGLSRFVPRLAARVDTFGLNTFEGAFEKIASLSVHPIDGPLWFVRTLLYLSILSPIIYMLIAWLKGWGALAVCMAWCIAEVCIGWQEVLKFVLPAYAVACFVAGGIIACAGKDLVEYFKSWAWILLGAAMCVVRATVSLTAQVGDVQYGTTVKCIVMVAAVLEAPALISLVAKFKIERIVKSRLYILLSQMSYFAYAGHFLFCSMWLHTLAPFMGGYWHGKFTVLISIFMSCGIATMLAVYYGGRKLFPKAMRVFDGTL